MAAEIQWLNGLFFLGLYVFLLSLRHELFAYRLSRGCGDTNGAEQRLGETRGGLDLHSLLYGPKFLSVNGRKMRNPVHSYAPMSGAASRGVPSMSVTGAPTDVPLSMQGEPTPRW